MIKKFPSEMRLDLTSGDWVVVATGRSKRPQMFKAKKTKTEKESKKDCPFCNLENQETPILFYSDGKKIPFKKGDIIPKKWSTVVIPNKFPAFLPSKTIEKKSENHLYQIISAVGFHEVLITKDHRKSLALLPTKQVKEVFDAFSERYKSLIKEKTVNYVAIFHNHGKEAGASVSHPHSQIIGIPLIDVDLKKALSNARHYFKKNNECIYCAMNKWEMKNKKRVVYQNKDFLVVCPFASKAAFQVIISPKKHQSYFEQITEEQKYNLADAFRVALHKLYKGLGNPAYNFYLHCAPVNGAKYPYYHWHWTILPKTSTWAGFELGIRMEISTIEPEKAAEYLRKQKI